MSKYSAFQNGCLEKMLANTKGKIILPTGGGKTTIEFLYSKSKLIGGDGKHQIVVVVAPRIILCQQLMTNFYNFFKEQGQSKVSIDERFLFVSCGKIPTSIKNRVGFATLNPTDVAANLKNHAAAGVDTVIFSTYKSFDICVEGIKLGRVGNEANTEVYLLSDEAHHFVKKTGDEDSGRTFNALKDNLDLFTSRFFLTATPIIKQDVEAGDVVEGSGMENTDIYGETIFEMKPRELIETGVLSKPLIHRVKLSDGITNENYESRLGDIIKSMFLAHETEINLGKSVKLGGKVLITVKSSDLLLSIKEGLKEWAQKESIIVAGTMSIKEVGSFFNYQSVGNIEDFLPKINGCCWLNKDKGIVNNPQRLILLHYDQLTEGIDVPSMTGIIILRAMTQDKIVQNIGRTLRTHPDDKIKEYREDYAGWIKPYSYIMFPKVEDLAPTLEYVVEKLRSDYDPNVKIQMVDAMGPGNVEQEAPTSHKFKKLNEEQQHEIERYNAFEKRLELAIRNKEVINPIYEA